MMMEFIYTDPNGIEQGPLLNSEPRLRNWNI